MASGWNNWLSAIFQWLTSGYYGFPVFSSSPYVLCEPSELEVTDVHHRAHGGLTEAQSASIIILLPNLDTARR
jgi:hypothetical protein